MLQINTSVCSTLIEKPFIWCRSWSIWFFPDSHTYQTKPRLKSELNKSRSSNRNPGRRFFHNPPALQIAASTNRLQLPPAAVSWYNQLFIQPHYPRCTLQPWILISNLWIKLSGISRCFQELCLKKAQLSHSHHKQWDIPISRSGTRQLHRRYQSDIKQCVFRGKKLTQRASWSVCLTLNNLRGKYLLDFLVFKICYIIR